MYLFRKATLQDLLRVYALKQEVVRHPYPGMSWSEAYPSEEVLKNDIQTGSMFLLLSETDLLLGVVSVNETCDVHYRQVNWQTPAPTWYMHRLFVNPLNRGEHLGAELISRVESEARNRAYRSIRFDSCTSNYPAHRLYERCGYLRCGEIPLTGKPGTYYAFEKSL